MRRTDLRSELPSDAPETEDHEVGFRRHHGGAATDLAQMKGIVNRPLDARGAPFVDDDGDVQLGGALRDRDHARLRRSDGVEEPRSDADRSGHAKSHYGENGGMRPHVDCLDLAKRDLLRECRAQRSLGVARYVLGHRETDRVFR